MRENERQLARENQAKYEKAQAHKNMIVSQYNSTMSAKEYQRVKGLVRMKTNFFK